MASKTSNNQPPMTRNNQQPMTNSHNTSDNNNNRSDTYGPHLWPASGSALPGVDMATNHDGKVLLLRIGRHGLSWRDVSSYLGRTSLCIYIYTYRCICDCVYVVRERGVVRARVHARDHVLVGLAHAYRILQVYKCIYIHMNDWLHGVCTSIRERVSGHQGLKTIGNNWEIAKNLLKTWKLIGHPSPWPYPPQP